MPTTLNENMEVLLERAPELAGKVRHALRRVSLAQHSTAAVASAPPGSPDWVSDQLERLSPDRLAVIFGLGPEVVRLKARADVSVWVVEPAVDRLIHYMEDEPVLPLLLRGRLLVGESVEEAEKVLASVPRLTLLRHPERWPEEKRYFDALEARLLGRADAARQDREQLQPRNLLLRAGRDTALGGMLAELPPEDPVTLDAVEDWVRERNRPWTQVERIFLTLNSFR